MNREIKKPLVKLNFQLSHKARDITTSFNKETKDYKCLRFV